jgi:ParB family chromosome partitioning protein
LAFLKSAGDVLHGTLAIPPAKIAIRRVEMATNQDKRRALGKGLDSLLPQVKASAAPVVANSLAEVVAASGKPLEIPLGDIERNPFQTRMNFDEKLLAELADSISANGVIQPIIVRPLPDKKYQLIAGERRLRASQKAGKATIPAILTVVSDEKAMEFTIIENLQRADLNPVEHGRAFDRLGREFGMTQETMSRQTGKDRSSVSAYLRILKFPEHIQREIADGNITFGHAKVLLSLEHMEQVETLFAEILRDSLSVRRAGERAFDLGNPGLREGRIAKAERAQKKALDPNVREAQEKLQRALGLRVKIEDNKGRGKVIIEYARLEDFDSLMDVLARE